jgi:Immunity protein 26
MKRITLQIGDIYEVSLADGKKGYVQYIGNDMTQLNSDVVRAFKIRIDNSVEPDLEEIVKSEVDFYSHVADIKVGIKDGSWTRVGHSDDVGDIRTPLFRYSRDYGNPNVKVSEQWFVWRTNEPMVYVGKLENENTSADIGVVTWPKGVVYQMQNGKFHGFYPDYK